MSGERAVFVKVTEQRIDETLGRTVGLPGGLDDIVRRNCRVLVKSNLVFSPTDCGITHTTLIEAVVRLMAETSPKEILIGEGSADVYASQGLRCQGLGRIAARYGARLIDLNVEKGKKPVAVDLERIAS